MARRTSLASLKGDIASAKTAPDPERPGIQVARFEELAPRPNNPRDPEDPNDTDDRQLRELVDSIRMVGQLQPAVVVSRRVYLERYPEQAAQVPEAAAWVIIIGNRRYRAAQLAGLPGLEIVVKEHLGDGPLAEHHLDEATMIENLHRRALPPLREAEFIERMVERYGSQAKVAERIAKTQAYVSQRLSLLRLHPELKARLERDELGVKEARTLAVLAEDAQLAAWYEAAGRRVADELRAQIEGGELAAGERLPAESELVGRFDVPEEAVVRAVKHLAAEGLIAVAEGSAATVRHRDLGHNPVMNGGSAEGIEPADGSGSPARPTEASGRAGRRSGRAGQGERTTVPMIQLESPPAIAAALRRYLSPTDLEQLVALLSRTESASPGKLEASA